MSTQDNNIAPPVDWPLVLVRAGLHGALGAAVILAIAGGLALAGGDPNVVTWTDVVGGAGGSIGAGAARTWLRRRNGGGR